MKKLLLIMVLLVFINLVYAIECAPPWQTTTTQQSNDDSSSGSSFSSRCIENWQCSDYSECINTYQTIDCQDLNNCGTFFDQPELRQSCTNENSNTISLQESNQESDQPNQGSDNGLDSITGQSIKQFNYQPYIIPGILSIIGVIIIIYLIFRRF